MYIKTCHEYVQSESLMDDNEDESLKVFAVKSYTTDMQRRSSMLAILIFDALIDTIELKVEA